MGVIRYRLKLTSAERQELERITNKATMGQSIVRRARLILLADAGMAHQDIAKELGLSRHSGVSDWIKRSLQKCEEPVELRLGDAPRSGAPPKVGPEQGCQLIALACERPQDYGRPITYWTHRELAEKLRAQGIVERISASQVGHLLKKTICNRTEAVIG